MCVVHRDWNLNPGAARRHSATYHTAQVAYYVAKAPGLRSQLFRRGGSFFGAGGRPLRDLVHLGYGLGDLIDSARLFLAAHIDLVYHQLDPAGLLGDTANGLGYLIYLDLARARLRD